MIYIEKAAAQTESVEADPDRLAANDRRSRQPGGTNRRKALRLPAHVPRSEMHGELPEHDLWHDLAQTFFHNGGCGKFRALRRSLEVHSDADHYKTQLFGRNGLRFEKESSDFTTVDQH